MCGIVGMISKYPLSLPQKSAFKDMLIWDTVRGYHSTGIATMNTGSMEGEMFKRALTAAEFLDLKPAKLMLKDTIHCIVGHNRQATIGAVNHKNAHPFVHGDIIGVHNGTLRSRAGLFGAQRFPVDSDDLIASINSKGADVIIPQVVGAFALVWINKKDKTLNLIRNSERPLWIATTATGHDVIFASEPWMIDAAISRNKCVEKFEEPVLIPVGDHVIVPLSNPEDSYTVKRELYKPVVTTYPKYNSSYPGYNQGYSNTHKPSGNSMSKVSTDPEIGTNITFTPKEAGTHLTLSNNTYKYVKGVTQDSRVVYLISDTATVEKVEARLKDSLPTTLTAPLWALRDTKNVTEYVLDGINHRIDVLSASKKVANRSLGANLKGYLGRSLTAMELRTKLNRGCCSCDKTVDTVQAGKIRWLTESSYLCLDCKNGVDDGWLRIHHTRGVEPMISSAIGR